MMRLAMAGLLAAAAMAVGCSVRGDSHPPMIRGEGIVNGYAGLSGIEPWSGKILNGSVLADGLEGDVIGLDIWPVGGVGIGVIGARLKLLVLDLGVGALAYEPKPAPWALSGAPAAEPAGPSEEAASPEPAYGGADIE